MRQDPEPNPPGPWLAPVGIGLALGFLFAPACSDEKPRDRKNPTDSRPTNAGAQDTNAAQTTGRPFRTNDGETDEFGKLPDKVGGWDVWKGATAGYVDDKACKDCHEPIWNSYQEVAMARSFYKLTPKTEVEDFDKVFFQKTTGDHYQMRKRDGKYFQARWRIDEQGNKYADYEVEVSWVIGSGNHVRTYLTQSEFGEMWELPLSWYADIGWEMSPSFEAKGHMGFERPISRECMFCHNAYPKTPLGGDLAGLRASFPHNLPHGIGCQRCHGPGARHIEEASKENFDEAIVRKRIVNPAKLPKQQREDTCMTCHMQPDVANGFESVTHRYDRPTYSHVPDRDLHDHMVYFDCGDEKAREAKFEVNHHAYRMRQSKCYTESGKMDCVTCHDPHRKIPKAERATFYRKKCLQCHELDDCRMEGMGTTLKAQEADCVSCHMVKARPSDVIHVVTTDHRIRRKKPAKDLTAPLPFPPAVVGPLAIEPAFPERAPKGDDLEIHRNLASRARFDGARAAKLVAAIQKQQPDVATAWSGVGRVFYENGKVDEAVQVLRGGLAKFPEDFDIQWNLAWALHTKGLNGRALELANKALAKQQHPRVLQLQSNILSYLKKPAEAVKALEKALELRPNQSSAWRQYAIALLQVRRPDEALTALRNAIRRNPDDGASYVLIADIMTQRGAQPSAVGLLEQAAPLVMDCALELIPIYLFTDPRLRNPARAEQIATEAIERESENPRAQLHHAFVHVILAKLDKVEASLKRARKLGADPASCTGVEMLLAAKKQDAARFQKLSEQFRKDLSKPSPERLRRHVYGVLQGMQRGR